MAARKPHKFRNFEFTDQFEKDLAKIGKVGSHDLTLLNQFMSALVAHDTQALVASWKDHKLNKDKSKGIEEGDRDAHIKDNLVVIYRIEADPDGRKDWELVFMLRIGTHADVLAM